MPRGMTQSTNISIEADTQYRSMFNIDNFKDTYKIKTFIEYADSKISQGETVFLDFNDMFIDTNRLFLLSRCEIKEFQPRWQYRPNYLSHDVYGTQSFSYLLLLINDVISNLDFSFDYVKVPSLSSIKELIINNQRLHPDRPIIKKIEFF